MKRCKSHRFVTLGIIATLSLSFLFTLQQSSFFNNELLSANAALANAISNSSDIMDDLTQPDAPIQLVDADSIEILSVAQLAYNKLKISWSMVVDADGYELFYSQSQNSSFTKLKTITSGNASDYIHSNCQLDKTYYYKIRSYQLQGKTRVYSPFSEITSGMTHVDPPSRVSVIHVNDIAYNKLKITWEAVPEASGYTIYCSTSPDGYFYTAKNISSKYPLEFIHSGRVLDKTYYYKVVPYITVGYKKIYAKNPDVASGFTHVDPPMPVSSTDIECVSYNQLKLSWKPVEDAYGYSVLCSSAADGKYSVVKTLTNGNISSFIHSGCALDKEYFYKVVSYKQAGSKKIYAEPSEIASASTFLPAPSAPTLKANSNSTITINVGKVLGAQKYNLYRSVDDGDYAFVKTIGNVYTDNNVVPNTKYSYTLEAVRGKVVSEKSPANQVNAILSAPAVISAASASADSVLVKWNKVTGASGYNVYISKSENGSYTLAGSTKILSFVAVGLETDATYYFKVKAFKSIFNYYGESDASKALSAIPKLPAVTITKVSSIGRASAFIECSYAKSVDGYKFYRADSLNGNYELIGESENNYYADNTVVKGLTYYYKVNAFKLINGTIHSNAPSMPAAVKITGSVSGNQISWITSNYSSYNKLNEKYSSMDTHFIGDTKRKVIYLNFSYGTRTPNASRVLDTLKEKNAPAGFFTLKSTVTHDQDIIHRIIDEGHILGNHTANNTSLVNVSEQVLKSEVDTMTKYVKSTYDYDMSFFSYPHGSLSIQGIDYVYSQNYTSIFYSYTYRDYGNTKFSNSYAYNNLTTHLHPGAIYLLHLECTANANVLGDFIDYARSQGYEVESLETLRNQ